MRPGLCIYTPLTASMIDSSFSSISSPDRSGTMSQHSRLALTLGKSVPQPQGTSPNIVAAITTRMANLSTSPSTGPDRLTSLPAELLQQVASYLSPYSVMALRITNKAASDKTFINFIETCLHSLTVQTTAPGVKFALRSLKIQGASKATTRMTFMYPPTTDSLRSTSLAGIPSQADLKALLAQLPNATSITIRDNTAHGLNVWKLCSALTTTPTKLTHLTLDSCAMPGSTLLQLLSAGSETLSYVALRNIHLTDSTSFKTVLLLLVQSCSLNRLVLDSLSKGDSREQTITMISRQALNTQRFPADHVTRTWTSLIPPGIAQQYTMSASLATMTGVDGVRRGLRGILSGRFR